MASKQGNEVAPTSLARQFQISLNESKEKCDKIGEELEVVSYQRDLVQKKYSQLLSQLSKRNTQYSMLKSQMKILKQILSDCAQKCFQLVGTGNSLTSFAMKSEQLRKQFAEQLRQTMRANEQLSNQCLEISQAKQLNEMKFEIIEEQLKFLYGSLQFLSNAKDLEDKYQFRIDQLNNQIEHLQMEKHDLSDQLRKTTSERDSAREDLKEMTASRTFLVKEKENFATSMKDKVNALEKDLKEKQAEFEKLIEDFAKMEKQNKQLLMEREKMKQRFIKLKNRRFKIDQNQKICKKCGKEYMENENYNWSCRTHQSEWGGEIWWCCGKTEKESLGCKFSKHESKEDDEDDADADDKLQDQLKQLKYIRCQCCKEIGHKIEACTRDPNLKTNKNQEDEEERIQRIRDFRKLFSDTMILTTHFFKKLVKVPKMKPSLLQEDDDIIKKEIEKQNQNAFQRGVMSFEDYNYNMYNPYILIDSVKGAKFQQVGYANSSKINSMDTGLKLTEQQLEQSISQTYQFDEINVGVKPDEEADIRIEIVKDNQQPKAEGATGGDDSQEDEDDQEDEDEDQYNIFFEKPEIELIKTQQQADAFFDIQEIKAQMLMRGDLKSGNKILIEDFMPKEESKNIMTSTRKRGKSMKSSQTGDQVDEGFQQDAEADEALALHNQLQEAEQHKNQQMKEQQDKKLERDALLVEIEELIKKERESSHHTLGDSQKEIMLGMGSRPSSKSSKNKISSNDSLKTETEGKTQKSKKSKQSKDLEEKSGKQKTKTHSDKALKDKHEETKEVADEEKKESKSKKSSKKDNLDKSYH